MTSTAAPRRAAAHRRPGWPTLTGLVALAVALGFLAWSAFDVYARPVVDPVSSARETAALRGAWASGAGVLPGEADAGQAVALVRIARFGASYEQIVVAGVDEASLTRGLGWYPDTAAPGEVGNLALAGHRDRRGPLAAIDTLAVGDRIEVLTREASYTYVVDAAPAAVADTDTWVLQPAPGRPDGPPNAARLTLTTNGDPLDPGGRTVVFATLTASGPPA